MLEQLGGGGRGMVYRAKQILRLQKAKTAPDRPSPDSARKTPIQETDPLPKIELIRAGTGRIAVGFIVNLYGRKGGTSGRSTVS